ncbi:diguanylate cyclase [Eubacteriaceae bacterium ES2]|nr:diguanylate cyclase [Eubacteriaceae bacterium ES2]
MIAYTLQTNITAIIILFIVYKGAKKHIDLSRYRDRIFMYLLYVNALILVIDSVSIVFYDVPGQTIHVIQSLLKMTFYILNPLPGFLWILYVYDFIFHNPKGLKRLFKIGIIPVLINAALAVASIWGGYLFILSPDNHYQRGEWFLLMPFFAFAYTIIAFIVILLNRKRIQRQDWLPLLTFAIPPAIGGFLQTYFYGLVLLWPSMTISLLIIYVFIQSKTINTDFLTGLNNRREFDYYLEDWQKWKKENKKIAGFMMDMDGFKEINDTYGHQTGDQALIAMSQILRASFRRNDFITRLGGDEFAAIIEVNDPQEIEVLKERLDANIEAFNQENKCCFQLKLSCGSGIFALQDAKSLRAFFDELDKKMYEEKQQRKILKKSVDVL